MNEIKLVLEKPLHVIIRRIISTFLLLSSLILLISWIFRDVLNLSQYSEEIVITSLGLFTLSQLINIEITKGMINAMSSFFSKLALSAFISSVVLFIFGFFGLEATLVNLTLPLFLSSIILSISSCILAGFHFRISEPEVSKKIKEIKENKLEFNNISIYFKNSPTLEISKRRKTIGLIIFNDCEIEIKTQIQPFKIKFNKPVLIYSPLLKIKGKKMNKKEIKEKYNLDYHEILENSKDIYKSFQQSFPKFKSRYEKVKLPFITVEEDEFGEKVKIGPLEITEEEGYEEISIGPFLYVSSSEGKDRKLGRFVIYSKDPFSLFQMTKNKIYAKWDERSLKIDETGLTFNVGGDEAIIKEKIITLRSLNYQITVETDKITITSSDFNLSVRGDLIRLVSKDKTLITHNSSLASKLVEITLEETKRQISDMIKGLPLDIINILTLINKILESELK